MEQIFAAAVLRAHRDAAVARKHGFPCDASGFVVAAVSDLWQYYGQQTDEANRIANKYVQWDADENPWPREDIDQGNVVLFPK